MRLSALAAVGAALAVVGTAGGEPEPMPLHGVRLRETGIHVVVAAKSPAVLDLDSERSTPIAGIPRVDRGFVWVVGVGRSAVVIARDRLYGVHVSGPASKLGPGSEAAPAPDGESVWVKRRVRSSYCTLRRVRLDGRLLRAPRRIRCSWRIYPGGSLGLGVSSTRIIDPATGRTVYKATAEIVAVAGTNVVLHPGAEPGVVNATSGTGRRLDWPEMSGTLFHRWVAAGRLVALDFANPSWTSEGRYEDDQYYDAWVVDAERPRVTRLPGMPAFVALKFMNIAWIGDGRLLVLARSGGRYVVALWKPGQEHLQVKAVRLPARPSGVVPSFAALG